MYRGLHNQRQPKLNRPVETSSNKAVKWTRGFVSTRIVYLYKFSLIFLSFMVNAMVWSKRQYLMLLSVTDALNLSDPPTIADPFAQSITTFLVSISGHPLPFRATALAKLISLSPLRVKVLRYRFQIQVMCFLRRYGLT